MLTVFIGTDTEKLRGAVSTAVAKLAKDASVIRITDAHSRADLDAALGTGGMFAEKRVVVFDQVLANDELREILLGALAHLPAGEEYFMLESAPDAMTKKVLQKYADRFEQFELPKTKKQETIFALGNALHRGDKKALWVLYQRELQSGKAPEAIHGVLFWAAKQALMRRDSEANRALVAGLAELPHEARRAGFDLEYALEHFVLART